MFTKFIEKIGMDKVAHFGVGAAIAYFIDDVVSSQDGYNDWHNILFCLIGAVVVAILAFAKEYVIDYKADKKDFVASVLGSLVPFMSSTIGMLLYIASH